MFLQKLDVKYFLIAFRAQTLQFSIERKSFLFSPEKNSSFHWIEKVFPPQKIALA